MVLPLAVDAEILPRIAFALKAGFFEQPHGSRVGRNAGGFQPMQPDGAEGEWKEGLNRRAHIALLGEWRANPIAQAAGLRDAASNVRQRQASDQHVVARAKYEERIGL